MGGGATADITQEANAAPQTFISYQPWLASLADVLRSSVTDKTNSCYSESFGITRKAGSRLRKHWCNTFYRWPDMLDMKGGCPRRIFGGRNLLSQRVSGLLGVPGVRRARTASTCHFCELVWYGERFRRSCSGRATSTVAAAWQSSSASCEQAAELPEPDLGGSGRFYCF